jgi:hypothetical protein
MIARHAVHRFLVAFIRDPDLREEFGVDGDSVMRDYGLSEHERAALLVASPESLGQLGVHPLPAFAFLFMRNPEVFASISVADYLNDIP